jgi:hypothetical protein
LSRFATRPLTAKSASPLTHSFFLYTFISGPLGIALYLSHSTFTNSSFTHYIILLCPLPPSYSHSLTHALMPQPPSLPHSPSTLQLLETLKITHQHSPFATPSLTFIPFLATDNSLPHSHTHSAEDTSACNETQLTLTHNTQQLTLLLTHSFRAFLGCLLFNHSCTALLHSYLTHRTRCTDATVAPSRAHAELLAQLDHTVSVCV